MAEKEKDQDALETPIENEEGQSVGEPSEEPKEESLTLESIAQLAKGLQKGYTITRQEMAEIRETLQQVAEARNAETEKANGEEEYLTTGKLREILQSQAQEQAREKTKAEKAIKDKIDGDLADLRAKGVIKSDKEEEELINYAISKKEMDLAKAVERWLEVKEAKEEAIKEAVKSKVKNEAQQKEGSKIGTSSKASVEEQGGIKYDEIRNKDWYEFE